MNSRGGKGPGPVHRFRSRQPSFGVARTTINSQTSDPRESAITRIIESRRLNSDGGRHLRLSNSCFDDSLFRRHTDDRNEPSYSASFPRHVYFCCVRHRFDVRNRSDWAVYN